MSCLYRVAGAAARLSGSAALGRVDLVVPFGLDADGAARAGLALPASLAGGVLLLQAWIADAAGPAGFSATNALSVLVE